MTQMHALPDSSSTPQGASVHLVSGDLFDLSTDGLKRTRTSHAGEIASLKTQYGIFTHLCRGGGEWLALSMPECCAALSGYGLTEIERTDGVALMAGYCRLLDEAGLVEEGHKTERAAVAALVERLRSNKNDVPTLAAGTLNPSTTLKS